MADYLDAARGLVDFIGACPSMFHTTATIRRELDEAGFTYLPETAAWNVCPGGSYYTVRNGSTVIAWVVGAEVGAAVCGVDDAALPYHFRSRPRTATRRPSRSNRCPSSPVRASTCV